MKGEEARTWPYPGNAVAPLMTVTDLVIEYQTPTRTVPAVKGVSLSIEKGLSLGLVGESGCGKSTLAYAMLGFLRDGGKVVRGAVELEGESLFDASSNRLRVLRRSQIGFVPQNPATALTPTMKIGRQLLEIVRLERPGAPTNEMKAKVGEITSAVGLPRSALDRLPHQLSGGQQQRVAIALALLGDPQLLVLDEPTTGLDSSTQAVILQLLRRLQVEFQLAMLYVSHDLSVISQVTNELVVMYAGSVVESGPTAKVLARPRHPYTRALVSAVAGGEGKARSGLRGVLQFDLIPAGCPLAPRCQFAEERCETERQELVTAGDRSVACWKWNQLIPFSDRPKWGGADVRSWQDKSVVMRVTDLVAGFDDPKKRGRVVPVAGPLSMELRTGEILGLIGESGSGKTSVARAMSGLVPRISGEVELSGVPLAPDARARTMDELRSVQLVFQNPDSSLNPRLKIRETIAKPLKRFHSLPKSEITNRVAEILKSVHLDPGYASRYPRELSGGERQRIAIARALAADPMILICDEVTSALDVSIEAAVVDLIDELRYSQGLAVLFITHNLSLLRRVAERTVVLYSGTVLETGDTSDLFAGPRHPYTDSLLSVVAPIGEQRRALQQSSREPADASTYCPYLADCFYATEYCAEAAPTLIEWSSEHFVRCHYGGSELARMRLESGGPSR